MAVAATRPGLGRGLYDMAPPIPIHTKLHKHLAAVVERLLRGRPLADHAEIAIECDPNLVTSKKLEELRAAGFNRISFGLQDFQKATLDAVVDAIASPKKGSDVAIKPGNLPQFRDAEEGDLP